MTAVREDNNKRMIVNKATFYKNLKLSYRPSEKRSDLILAEDSP